MYFKFLDKKYPPLTAERRVLQWIQCSNFLKKVLPISFQLYKFEDSEMENLISFIRIRFENLANDAQKSDTGMRP